jgi:O-antigen ligase
MDCERIDKWCERGILGLVLVILVFGPLATGAVRPLEFLIIQALTIGTLLLWLCRLWVSRSHRFLFPPVCWTILAFAGYSILRYQHADIEYVARQELIRVLVYAVLAFVILNNLSRPEFTQFISHVIVFLGMAISLYAVYQFATNSPYVWQFVKPVGYLNRGSGTYICPNHLAGFLEMVLPLAMAYTFTSRVSHLLRVFLGYAALAILAGIAVSLSRGGWVASGLTLLAFFVLLIQNRRYRIAAVVALLALVAGIAVFYTKWQQARERFTFAISDPFGSPGLRILLIRSATRMWLDHFWFGVGPGHFDYRFAEYRPPRVQAQPGRVHNDYLNTLADWGVVGGGLVAAGFGLVGWGVVKAWKFVRLEPGDFGRATSNRGAFVSGAALGLFALLIHSCFDFNLHIPANAILAVALMALLSGHLRYATERFWVRPSLTLRILVTVSGLVGVVCLAQYGVQQAREYVWLERAGRARVQLEAGTAALRNPGGSSAVDPPLAATMAEAAQRYRAALEEAVRAEPANAQSAYELGEVLRGLSWQGQSGYEALATNAMRFFQTAARLNPFDAHNYMRIGMCLDWLERHEEAEKYFEEAIRRDPNSYYVRALVGWHCVQVKDYDRAEDWFRKSLEVKWIQNPIADSYLSIIQRARKEAESKRP